MREKKPSLLKRLFEGLPADPKLLAGLLLGLYCISGLFGFLYETGFYLLNDGYLSRRGNAFGPWIELYSLGGLLIFLACWRLRKKPWLVALVSGGLCGVLELIVGWILWEGCHMRAWDYNVEKWNWGNLGGYVCFRSVLVFALSGMLLVYVVVPLLLHLSKKMKPTTFLLVFGIPGVLCLADNIYNDLFVNVFHLPGAIQFWYNTGLYGEHVSGIEFVTKSIVE